MGRKRASSPPSLQEHLRHLTVPVLPTSVFETGKRRLPLLVSVLGRKLEGRGTIRSRLVRVGAGLTEQTHHRQVSALRCKHEGRGIAWCCLVLAGTGLTEQTHTSKCP